MAINNPIQELKSRLLVRAFDNFLTFNDEVWQSLGMAWDNNRIFVLSVIGQPGSSKSALLRDIIYSLGDGENVSSRNRFDSDDGTIQSTIDEGGLLAYKCTTRNTTFLLLDIWSTHCMKETYKKLVDFCVLASSIVIFSESWEQEISEIYWSPELSTVAEFNGSLLGISKELHFLIETDKFCGPNRVYLKGQPSNHKWDDSISSLHGISFGTFWESIASHVTTSYISSANDKASVRSSALTRIISNRLDTNDKVYTEHIRLWISECLQYINEQPLKSVHDSVGGEDIVMKSVVNAKENDPNVANKTSENLSHCDDHSDTVHGNELSRSDILRRCYDCVNLVISHDDFGQIEENVLDQAISQHFSDHISLQSDVKKFTEQWLLVLRCYNIYLTNALQEVICVDDSEFENLHGQSSKMAKEVVGWNVSEYVDEKVDRLIAQLKTKRWIVNKLNYENEKRIAETAQQFAVTRFQTLMEGTLSVSTFSESEFRLTYNEIVYETSTLFLEALGPSYAKLWKDEHERLNKTLSSMQASYAQHNKNRLSTVYEIRRVAIETAKQCYQEEMEKNLPGTMVTTNKFDSISQTCSDAARRVFHQMIGKNINKNIAMTWEGNMNCSLEEMKSTLIAKNDKLPSSAKPTVQLPTGFGLYIDQHTVTVCMDQQIPSVSTEQHHNIVVHNGKIPLDSYAWAGTSHYTVFQLLTESQRRDFQCMNVDGTFKTTGTVGILSMYFLEIRMQVEQKVKQHVSSCFVTVTGLLTSKAKQLLKTSLKIAGFERNTLIPSTTAMAISYSRQLHEFDRQIRRNLFIYISSDMVELAVADVSGDSVNVLKICGNYQLFLKNILPEREFTNVVVWKANDPTFVVKFEVKKFLADCSYDTKNTITFDTLNVTKVGAMLDSKYHHNTSALHRIPRFNFIHPYKILVYRIKNGRRKPEGELTYNVPMKVASKTDDNLLLIFVEQAILCKGSNPFIVEDYSMQCCNGTIISLEEEGYLSTSPQSAEEKQWFDVMRSKIKRRMEHLRIKYGVPEQLPASCAIEAPSVEGNSHERRPSQSTSEKLLNDLKESVTILVEKTRLQLTNSKETPAAHRENIESKIEKCESLMKSSNIKVKQLEIEKSLLECAVKFIK